MAGDYRKMLASAPRWRAVFRSAEALTVDSEKVICVQPLAPGIDVTGSMVDAIRDALHNPPNRRQSVADWNLLKGGVRQNEARSFITSDSTTRLTHRI